jgi:hypothetical protein
MKVNILKERNGRHELQLIFGRSSRMAPVILRGQTHASVSQGLRDVLDAVGTRPDPSIPVPPEPSG